MEAKHFKQKPRRRAEFITPPNLLKAKVGNGGLGDDIIKKAQALLENNTTDFQPLGEMYLETLMSAIEQAKGAAPLDDSEYIISCMLYPAMQLKANGGMFQYPLVTNIADRLIQFLEVIREPDIEAVEIVLAFHTTIRAIVLGRVKGNGGAHAKELINALNEACLRYFEKNPSEG